MIIIERVLALEQSWKMDRVNETIKKIKNDRMSGPVCGMVIPEHFRISERKETRREMRDLR